VEWDEIRKVTRVRCIEDVIVKDTRLRDFEIGDFEAKQPLDKSPIIAFVKGKIYDARLGILQNSPWDVPIRALYVPKNEEGFRHYIATEKEDNEFFNRYFEIVRKGRK